MYEVFINDKPLKLSKNPADLEGDYVSYDPLFSWEKSLHLLREGELSSLSVYAADLNAAWQAFKNCHLVIKAGGGVVKKNGHLLFIYRNGKWDLPKGKMEEGECMEECARREVEEECGITRLTIEKKLPKTYHTYSYKGAYVLKVTDWYLMGCTDESDLVPQIEEGIEEVEWKNPEAVQQALKNTYPNIKLVLEAALC